MQNDTSRFVVNIIPLQNIQTNTSGLSPTQSLSNAVSNIQQMVNYDQKRIYVDTIQSFTQSGTINVLSPMNMSNVTFTQDEVPINSGTSLSNGISYVNVGASNVVLGVSSDILTVYSNSNVSTVGSLSVGGTCYAQTFVTLSDREAKTSLSILSTRNGLENISAYVYEYKGRGKKEIGLLAQEVESVYPECVREEDGVKYVNYDGLVAVLLEEVKDLKRSLKKL